MSSVTITPSFNNSKIQTAINAYNHIIFSAGTYSITQTLVIPSNCHIELEAGAILRRDSNIQAIFMSEHNESTTKYNGASNIIIEGGQFYGVDSIGSYDNFITMFHAKDVVIRNVEFFDTQGFHSIEVNACDNVKILGCKFRGYRTNTTGSFREAIQIDFAGYSELVTITDSSAACYDNTCCKNITIDDCVFESSKWHSAPNTAIGAHSRPHSNDKHTNILITNNIAVGGEYSGCFVSLIAMKDVLIKGNIVEGYDRFIKIQSPLSSYYSDGTKTDALLSSEEGICSNIIISDNIIKNPVSKFVAAGIFTSSGSENCHYGLIIHDNLFDVPLDSKMTQYASFIYCQMCHCYNNIPITKNLWTKVYDNSSNITIK